MLPLIKISSQKHLLNFSYWTKLYFSYLGLVFLPLKYKISTCCVHINKYIFFNYVHRNYMSTRTLCPLTKYWRWEYGISSTLTVSEFVRSKFPYKLVQPINDNTIDIFLSSWVDNRVRVLIFEKHEAVRLRYILMAFYYRDRVAFGWAAVRNIKILIHTLDWFDVDLKLFCVEIVHFQ